MFSAHRSKDNLYVIPSDVRSAVDGGRLDRRLFDVAALDDDRSSSSIPLLITTRGKRATVPGATLTRELRSVNGAAIKVDKSAAASFLARAAGMGKIWLDGNRKLALDQSVPQIGAPAAWQAGFTGAGVSVAVLDSGIDTSHPDLATQVAAAKNFTDTPDGDQNGHGTHVASTIAGTGAASSGLYQGVAPQAKLYDGKVCDENGRCPESAILAGMEWAATEAKAKIVNVSLAGTDTPAEDPLEEAVNRLSTQTGALFVIAAGNEGPDAHTVASPGSAEAALTVGAVDKENQLADFSGRGPSGGAVKPDLTAPGVSIVAAKAKDSTIGEPVGDDYLRLDGTSMATPHVAGSAALLAQQHPDWKATELKGALVGSARPAADQTAFEQGAGRVDVAQGIKQTVIAEPGNLSFGTASWPHDDDTPGERLDGSEDGRVVQGTVALGPGRRHQLGDQAGDGKMTWKSPRTSGRCSPRLDHAECEGSVVGKPLPAAGFSQSMATPHTRTVASVAGAWVITPSVRRVSSETPYPQQSCRSRWRLLTFARWLGRGARWLRWRGLYGDQHGSEKFGGFGGGLPDADTCCLQGLLLGGRRTG